MKLNKRKWVIAGNIVLWVGILTYLGISIAFVNGKSDDVVCRKVEVIIADSLQNRFVNKDDVIKSANSVVKQLVGTRINKINAHKIEKRLLEMQLLKSADVYSSVDGVLTIRVYQRDAIMRVYNADGTSNYVDSEGYIIPLSARYAANVVIVNGNINLRKTANGLSRIYTNTSDSTKKMGLAADLLNFVTFIKNDSFWSSQVVQIYVNSAKDVDLITRVGSHIVKMGSLDDYEKKLTKLMAFYKNALPSEGWNKYSVINLKYGNQVICKK